MALSIRGRLTVWYGLVLLAVLVAAGTTLLIVHGRLGLADLDRELGNRAATVVAELREELSEEESLEEGLAEIDEVELPGTGVAVVDAENTVLSFRAGGPWDPSDADLAALADGTTVETAEGRARLRSVELGLDAYPLRVVVWMSQAGFDRERSVLRRALLLGVPLALAIAVAGGWSISRRSLSPLSRMAEQTEAISERRLDARLRAPNAEDELGVLARAFNALLDRLAGALELQRRLMTDASHELRTPVSVVRTTAQVTLGRDTRTEAEYRDALHVIREQADRMSRMVDDMLLLALADADGRPLQPSTFYLDELVQECARAARALGASRHVEVEVVTFTEIPITGDEALLRQMLLNLLDNGVRHAAAQDQHGRVEIEVTKTDGNARITVTDTGPGIAEDDRERIFERFVRGATAGGRVGGGLGLPIARWIAEAHRGSVEAVTATDGAQFVVVLPLVPPDTSM